MSCWKLLIKLSLQNIYLNTKIIYNYILSVYFIGDRKKRADSIKQRKEEVDENWDGEGNGIKAGEW